MGIKSSKNPEMVITCKEVTHLIMDYINNELDAGATESFESHLNDCDDCIAFLNTYKRTIEGIRSMKPEDVPQKIIEKVRDSLMKKLLFISFIIFLC